MTFMLKLPSCDIATSLKAKVLIVLIFLLKAPGLYTQNDISYYLPDIKYDSSLTTPSSFLSFEVGDWHVTHGQLVHYLSKLCEESPNCQLTEYARSHENKPLIYLTISSTKNLENIASIKAEHNKLTEAEGSDDLDVTDIPLVLYQGYSIHGNESSGANAAMLVAYYLLAGQSPKTDRLLDQSIILLDPCYNPDGFQRFSTWANMHRHARLNSDTNDREFDEVWPGGRTNHYWFDLNRDWLFNIHPSSKGRIKVFHEWKPDILTDHHEMGSNSTFFFQPGVPERTNPLTPQLNQDLTEEIGSYHASFLDSIGSAYFTKERYDDFFYGKGSTYPDINGCIGILFEQASSRGHLRETQNGLLSFPFTIRNQVVSSLSTQEAALALKDKILNYKRDFYSKKLESKDQQGYYIFECKDNYMGSFIVNLLNRHEIDVYRTKKNKMLEGINFAKGDSYVVPKDQKQSGLVQTLFERVHEFRDSIFYDISSWTLPLAMDIKYAESLKQADMSALDRVTKYEEPDMPALSVAPSVKALAVSWHHYLSPAFLNNMLENKVKVNALTKDGQYSSSDGTVSLRAGTLVMPLPEEMNSRKSTIQNIEKYAREWGLPVIQLNSLKAREGLDLGSNDVLRIKDKDIAMLVGEGINAYEAGEAWHQLDKRWQIQFTKLDMAQLSKGQMARYDVLIMPDGYYSNRNMDTEILKDWLQKGGRILAFRRAVDFLNKLGWISNLKEVEADNLAENDQKSYSNYGASKAAQRIKGCIFNADINLSHPLFYGYTRNQLPVFKRGTQFYQMYKASAIAMKYTDEPLLSGYCSDENIEKARNAAAVFCSAVGRGSVISSVDNPNFRGFWMGGSKLFANMIFMADAIERDTMD